MNLQLLPEIALSTVPNFRGYFYTNIYIYIIFPNIFLYEYIYILYPQKAIPKKKKGHASTDFCRSYSRM
jgi:hypothetical protein